MTGLGSRFRWAICTGTALGMVAFFTPVAVANGAASAPQAATSKIRPAQVKTSADQARHKIDKKLLRTYDKHEAGSVPVFVSVVGDTGSVVRQMDNAHATHTGQVSLVVGRVPSAQLVKLASDSKVLSVRPISFHRDGQPADFTEHPSSSLHGKAKVKAVEAVQSTDVPYSDAPKPRSSTFQQFKKLNVLDAKTHNFTQAWRQGITGKGTTVAVFDSGSDWSHPDLREARIARDASGWPRAYDPFGTLQWLAAPEQIDQGLSWYVRTTPVTCGGTGPLCAVKFSTKTGPSRNLANPAGANRHTYTFPRSWSKSGHVRLGSHPDDYALQFFGERPAFLVTDPHKAGVYDTIYVDLNDNHFFGGEKPVTKQSPRSWRDLNGDGFADLSGGLAYYISDGTGKDGRAVPGGLEAFGATVKAAPGALVAWTGDFDTAIGGHGTLCASNIVGQGVSNGNEPSFSDIPGRKYPAAVVGGAPDATMVPFGDIYFSFDFSTQFAYLLSNATGIDVTSNSYGNSADDNDGLDAASQEADIWHTAFGGRTTPVFSTGNGAPGFGTTTPPAPVTGIKVGASTQFGATGWDSITKYSQVNDNDVANWSDRGPGSTGSTGLDMVADGAYSSGDVNLGRALEEGRDGQNAWETWGGTSRSTPVTVGATALVYQAYRATHSSIPQGFNRTVKTFIKSGATDLGYESYIQGAGSLNAGRSVRLAEASTAHRTSGSASGAAVSPDEWRPGDYRGKKYAAFPHLMAPGQTSSQRFKLSGTGGFDVSDRVLRRTAVSHFDFTTSDVSKETPFLFNAPNYAINLTKMVKQHKDADLMVIRASYPYGEFDPNNDYSTDQQWRMVTYNWTDQNHDGKLFTDDDHDGTIDNFPSTKTDIDGEPIPAFPKSEVERGEYERFTYINQATNAYTNMIRSPAERMNSGLFVGFYHNLPDKKIARTHFHFTVEFYSNRDWGWVSTPKRAAGAFTASLHVPSGTPYGLYDGAVVVRNSQQQSIVPIAVTVAATAKQNAAGQLTQSIRFGGNKVARDQRNQLYNNGSVFDAKDWGWRAESGDWRFFYFDVPKTPPAGTKFLAETDFAGPAPHNDLDTLIFGRTQNSYQLVGGSDPIFAPYALGTVGASQNTNVGAGVWLFNTATGTNKELISAPAAGGLHAVVHHEVNMQHNRGQVHMPFTTTLASATVSPDHVDQKTSVNQGSFDVTFTSGIAMDGLKAEAFGLSQPQTTSETAHQDDPNDPSTASVKRSFTLNHAGRVTLNASSPSNDIDLYVVRDNNGDGKFTTTEIVAASATGSGDESVTLSNPPDGNYQVWVHGFQVSGTPTFPLTIDAVQGNDMSISGVPSGSIPAGKPVTLHVTYSKSMTAGQDYNGLLQLGPPATPTLLSVPVVIHRT